jgi:hypothetical protein
VRAGAIVVEERRPLDMLLLGDVRGRGDRGQGCLPAKRMSTLIVQRALDEIS